MAVSGGRAGLARAANRTACPKSSGVLTLKNELPGRVERREVVRAHLPDADGREQILDLQVTRLDVPADPVPQAPRVHRAQRLHAVGGPRHHRVGRPVGQRRQPRQHARAHEREVARDDEHVGRRRLAQRRVEAAERPGTRHPVGDDAHLAGSETVRFAADHDDPVRQALERRQLPLEDGHGADPERALVGAVQPARPAAGENGDVHWRFYLSRK